MCFMALLICANEPTCAAEKARSESVFGYVISKDLEKRILTFQTETGKEMKVRLAADIQFRRLDGRPNKLETLAKGHKVRVNYQLIEGEIPVVKNLLARVVGPGGANPKARSSKGGKRGPGEFKPRVLMKPRRAIVDATYLKAGDVTDQVTDNELVLGVEIDGKARAYPINMLTGPSREIINEVMDGTPYAATW
jgi:hypothetical protein